MSRLSGGAVQYSVTLKAAEVKEDNATAVLQYIVFGFVCESEQDGKMRFDRKGRLVTDNKGPQYHVEYGTSSRINWIETSPAETRDSWSGESAEQGVFSRAWNAASMTLRVAGGAGALLLLAAGASTVTSRVALSNNRWQTRHEIRTATPGLAQGDLRARQVRKT